MINFLKAAVLAGVICTAVTFGASAQAAECPGDGDVGGDLLKAPDNYTDPTLENRHKVEDFISRYAWLMDSQSVDLVMDLFDTDVDYVKCITGQPDFKKQLKKPELTTELKNSFKALADGKLRARRLFSNILIRQAKDGSFEAIISSVVFLQSLTSATSPQPDYMASLYVTIGGDPLQFKVFKLISDPMGIVIFAR